ncbi:unnamed protein product [Acanthoscelides obtectus]|uniref:Uncharacterized protein n=1 Tax=Acanthoscelides obtectus TaxID=200917 RepID=A0A9P0LWY3_ACAOB|nr:unnamed protein product [Acanthoscelides obtectus]CAK1642165.1 Protein C3orf33 [Acanthoscelides obtectus]
MEKAKEKASNAFHSFSSAMERNSRGVEIGCYSVALIGLTVALRKVRPFSKFRKASDIPNHFIREKRELIGYVNRIEPDGALLMVQHKPLINLPFIRASHLPVKISGVRVSGLGLSWLQTVVAGKEIKFIPIVKERDFVQCQVFLEKQTKEKKPHVLNVGESLLKIGFAVTEHPTKPLSEDPSYLTYYHRLQSAENYALRQKMGLRYYIAPTRELIFKLYSWLNILIDRLIKQITKTLPKVPKFYVS